MRLDGLIERAAQYDENLAREIKDFVRGRKYGLVYEASKPEFVRMWKKPIVRGDLVNILPPRGVLEDTKRDDDPAEVVYKVLNLDGDIVKLKNEGTDEECEAAIDNIVALARFDKPIYTGMKEVGRIERGGDKPYHVVINGENYHALQTLVYAYQNSVDCIYIDPPYNSGAKDWKYNNNYVGKDDQYRHSKWLTFMEDRLKLAKKLLNPKESVLIVAIDDKEYLRLGLLLEQIFPEGPECKIQMITTVTNPSGTSRGETAGDFSTVNEYLYFVRVGDSKVRPWTNSMLPIIDETGKVKAGPRTVGGLKWESFLRSGKGNNRQARPNLFYPVYVEKSTMRIMGAGDPCSDSIDALPREYNGYAVAWPLKRDGSSAIWHLEKASLLKCLEKGYAYVSSYDDKRATYTIQYLTSGVIKSIENGTIPVERSGDRGQVIALENVRPTEIPKNVWNMRSHNAGMSGSDLLSQFLPGRDFPYPKSLYAVEDTLRFFVGNKKDAVVLDFFSGSGTTANAVMRLNHQDEGHRLSISVTNNEISAEEAILFTKRGLRQGDEEWENYGIARYITFPRIAAAITGQTPDGHKINLEYKFFDEFPASDGFEENAIFFDLEYLEPSVVSADLAFNNIAPILWMCGGCKGEILARQKGCVIGETYAILFDPRYTKRFVDSIIDKPEISTVFIVTDAAERYRSLCAELPGRRVLQLYESYLRSFEINAIG